MHITKKNTVLIADDDSVIREAAHVLFEREGLAVLEAATGEEALASFYDDVDLVILDVTMPGMSGYEVCEQLRARSNVPILFLSAKSQDADMAMGFSSGGDDFLVKPFSNAELLARAKALLRRYKVYQGYDASQVDPIIEWRGIRVDDERKEVWKAGRMIALPEKSYQILRLMLLHHGKIFSPQELYEIIWEAPYLSSTSNTVMVHIRKLREKIEDDPQKPEIVTTVWGQGYRID